MIQNVSKRTATGKRLSTNYEFEVQMRNWGYIPNLKFGIIHIKWILNTDPRKLLTGFKEISKAANTQFNFKSEERSEFSGA